jgi:hypothetical protein
MMREIADYRLQIAVAVPGYLLSGIYIYTIYNAQCTLQSQITEFNTDMIINGVIYIYKIINDLYMLNYTYMISLKCMVHGGSFLVLSVGVLVPTYSLGR